MIDPQSMTSTQSIDQPINQSISHLINQPVNQSINQSIDEPDPNSIATYANQRYRSIYNALSSVSICALSLRSFVDGFSRFDLEIIGTLNNLRFALYNPPVDHLIAAQFVHSFMIENTLLHPEIAVISPQFKRLCFAVDHSTNQSTNQPNDQSSSQPHSQSASQSSNQASSQSINQSNSQSSNPSQSQSNNQSINQSINQSNSHHFIGELSRSMNETINQSVDQITKQSVNQSLRQQVPCTNNPFVHRSSYHVSPNQSIKQSTKQPISQSNKQSTKKPSKQINQLSSAETGRLERMGKTLLRDYMVIRNQMLVLYATHQAFNQSIDQLRSDFVNQFSYQHLTTVMQVHDMPHQDRAKDDLAGSIINYMSGSTLIDVPYTLFNHLSDDIPVNGDDDDDDVMIDDERSTVVANHPSSESNNQPFNQPVNLPIINQMQPKINESVNSLDRTMPDDEETDEESETDSYFSEADPDIDQSINLSVDQSLNLSVKQPVIQLVDQSINQSIDHRSRSSHQSVDKHATPAKRSNDQSITQSSSRKRLRAELSWSDADTAIMSIPPSVSINQRDDPSIDESASSKNNQSIDKSGALSGDQLTRKQIAVATGRQKRKELNQLTQPTINQSIKHSAVNQSAITPAINHSAKQSGSQSSSTTINQSADQLVNQAVKQSVKSVLNKSTLPSLSQLVKTAAYQSNHQFHPASYPLAAQSYRPPISPYTLSMTHQSITESPQSAYVLAQSTPPLSFKQSTNQSTNQPGTPQIHHSATWPINQSPSHPMQQHSYPSYHQSYNQSYNQSINQPINQSVNKSNDKSNSLTAIGEMLCSYLTPRDSHSAFQLNRKTRSIHVGLLYSINQQAAAYQTALQSINQSVNQSPHHSIQPSYNQYTSNYNMMAAQRQYYAQQQQQYNQQHR